MTSLSKFEFEGCKDQEKRNGGIKQEEYAKGKNALCLGNDT